MENGIPDIPAQVPGDWPAVRRVPTLNMADIVDPVVPSSLLKAQEKIARVMPGGSPVFPSSDDAIRSQSPVVTGCLDYFPLALLEIARFSAWANTKHNGPNAPLHWSRGKSFDHANKIGRHLLERGTLDPDTGMRFSHSVGLAWRALALLQKEREMAQGYDRDAPEGQR